MNTADYDDEGDDGWVGSGDIAAIVRKEVRTRPRDDRPRSFIASLHPTEREDGHAVIPCVVSVTCHPQRMIRLPVCVSGHAGPYETRWRAELVSMRNYRDRKECVALYEVTDDR